MLISFESISEPTKIQSLGFYPPLAFYMGQLPKLQLNSNLDLN